MRFGMPDDSATPMISIVEVFASMEFPESFRLGEAPARPFDR